MRPQLEERSRALRLGGRIEPLISHPAWGTLLPPYFWTGVPAGSLPGVVRPPFPDLNGFDPTEAVPGALTEEQLLAGPFAVRLYGRRAAADDHRRVLDPHHPMLHQMVALSRKDLFQLNQRDEWLPRYEAAVREALKFQQRRQQNWFRRLFS